MAEAASISEYVVWHRIYGRLMELSILRQYREKNFETTSIKGKLEEAVHSDTGKEK